MSNDSTKCVLETVTRVPKSGICQGLIVSQSFVIKPKDATKHDYDENIGNRLRFQAVLQELQKDDYVMILRSSSNPEKPFIKSYFVLIPSTENGYFLLSQIGNELPTKNVKTFSKFRFFFLSRMFQVLICLRLYIIC